MKKVYTHQNPMIVGNARGLLEAAGIEVVLRNEYAQGASGELAVFETWPELWVVEERDYPRAVALLQGLRAGSAEPDWVCGACGETNPDSFETCWHCGQMPEPPTAEAEGGAAPDQ